jgi:hypothetical protein
MLSFTEFTNRFISQNSRAASLENGHGKNTCRMFAWYESMPLVSTSFSCEVFFSANQNNESLSLVDSEEKLRLEIKQSSHSVHDWKSKHRRHRDSSSSHFLSQWYSDFSYSWGILKLKSWFSISNSKLFSRSSMLCIFDFAHRIKLDY